jgi:hypothetical protein
LKTYLPASEGDLGYPSFLWRTGAGYGCGLLVAHSAVDS